LRDARQSYLRWGASGKVRQLDELHPRLIEETPVPGPTSTVVTAIEDPDLATVMKVSQALSGEMALERLTDVLMRLAIEYAGAERGLLLLSRGSELRQEAEAITSREGFVVRRRDEFVAAFPDTVVDHVMRTHDILILDDASVHPAFSANSYVRERNARSVLCLPLVSEAKMIGVLYLENNLSPGVFTAGRISILKLLALQAAISLENTYLYHDIAEREAKIRHLVDANIIGIMIWNIEGRIIEANDAFLRIVGYAREDLVSGRLSWKALTPAEWLDRDEKQLVPELWKTGNLHPFEKEYFRKDGSRVPVMIGAARFGDRSDEGVSFIVDLTEQRRTTEALRDMQFQLQHANRIATIGQLTSSIAHEVNQPISGIVTNANAVLRMLARSEPPVEAMAKAVGRILRDGTRAGDIVDRLRNLIKKAPPRHACLEINPLIHEVIDIIRGEATKTGVSVQTALGGELLQIRGDRVELQQVILNLIINAIEAMSGDGQDRELRIVSGKTEAGHVFVSVRDSGPGLAPAAFGLVFEPFHTTKPGGLGLGLSICRSIIEAHGGRLWAGANSPRGAVFQFELPSEFSSELDMAVPE
jgi:PAS domain S-box-containing protein